VVADAAVADAAVADAANADPLDAAKGAAGRVFFLWLDMRYAPAKPSRGIAISAMFLVLV
jgi:hypothetical protein